MNTYLCGRQISTALFSTLSSIALLNAPGVFAQTNCVPSPGQVSWWRGEGDGADSVDSNGGVLFNGVSFAPGMVGQAFNFNGSGAHVRITDRPNLHATTAITLEAWINPAGGGDRAIMGKWDNPPGLNQKTFSFSLTSDGRCYLLLSGNGTDSVSGQAISSNAVPAAQWSHVAGTYDGTSIRLYVNGAVQGQSAYNQGIFPGTDDMAIGGVVGGSPTGQVSAPFNGMIDEAGFYTRALSPAEILAIYNAGSAGKCRTNGVQPVITGQPQSLAVLVGGTANFSASASGTDPLLYQWTANGTNIRGATTPSLILTNVQLANAGTYDFRVTNAFGSTLSTNVFLTVIPLSSNCVPQPTGIVSWWQAEGDGSDSVDSNAGTLFNGVAFAPGMVGQAFSFNGTGAHVRIADRPNLHATNALTLEAWIKPAAIGGERAIIGKWDNPFGLNQKTFSFSLGDDGRFYLALSGNGSDSISGQAISSNSVVAGQWSHVAGVYEGSTIRVYVNGALQGQVAYSQGIFPGTNDMAIGGVVGGSPTGQVSAAFNGLIDEPTFYRRALSQTEILTIYAAGSAGKCRAGGLPPAITGQPQSLAVNAGGSASFSASASGTDPLTYQWTFNGSNIVGATTTSLTLANVQPANGGNYAFRVTNTFGFAVSSNALLTVIPSATNCVTPPDGLVSSWRADGDANDAVDNNSGTLLNGAGFAPGEVGQAFNLDGINDLIKVLDAPNLRFTNAMTVEAWIFPTSLGDSPHEILGKWDSPASADRSYTFTYYSSFITLGLSANGQDSGSAAAFSSNGPPANQWSHVAGTYDGTTIKVYINGSLQGSTPFTNGIFPGHADLSIGADLVSAAFFKGKIDEPSVYRRALSPAEIQAIYTAGSGGKCLPVNGTPPSIVTQPLSRTVIAGATTSFFVTTAGTLPLSYQWTYNGSNILAATTTSLTLSNVQVSQSGNYRVLVTNAFGSALSTNALLTVTPSVTNCVAPSTGLVSWWPGEGNALDIADGNPGIIYAGVTFAPGEVGQAFSLSGSNAHVRVSDRADLHFTTAMTVESWVNPARFGVEQAIVGKWDNFLGLNQKTFSFSIRADGRPYLLVSGNGNDGVSAQAISSNTIPLSQWSHVAGTYDGTSVRIYVNGTLQGQMAYNQGIFPGTNDLAIGGVVGGSPPGDVSAPYAGKIDEVSLYNRALSGSELASIYNAGAFGKCHIGIAPSITAQPLSQAVTAGSTATFVVGAAGTSPLAYQWLFNGANIAGATASTLTLSNVQPANAGNYSISVSNAFGSITSSNAALTVNIPPATVKVIGVTNIPAGGLFTVPVILTANGNENALSFTLNFDASKLSYISTAQGSDAGSATFFLNETGSSTGRVGVALALPIGTTFAPGAREVAEVTFNVLIVTNASSTSIGFADQPVLRQLSDAAGVALPATYLSGNVSIAAVQFEGDVSPRTNGNQAVTVTDWVLIGLFAAGLDHPLTPSEFQRADCAPRSSLGNGHITVTDWVQAGRYVAGLDPLTPVGGPTGPFSANTPLLRTAGGPYGPSVRQVLLSDTAVTAGQPGSVKVTLHGSGDETALGFSVIFDPSSVSFVSASLAPGVTGATLNVNSQQAAQGHLGFLLGLSGTNRFLAGDNSLVQINFQAVPTAGGQYSVGFGDSPVFREISDFGANALPSDYLSSSVNIAPLPALTISHSGPNLILSWPSWASSFKLQSADSLSAPWNDVNATVNTANGQNSVALPISGAAKLYRLYQH